MGDGLRLLIAAARGAGARTPAPGSVDELRAAAQVVTDWPATLDEADAHGMLPLVCARLLGAGSDVLAPGARDQVQAAYRESAAQSLAGARQLTAVVSALAGAGITALPIKGPALALDAYGGPTLRSFDDLDVIVRPEDLARAIDALTAAGYGPAGGASLRDALAASEWQGQLAFSRDDGSLPVELHWRFCDRKLPWSPVVSEVIGRAGPRDLAGRPVLVPARTDQVLLVLLHAARHGWDQLEGAACVGALIDQGVSGPDLLAHARRIGGVRASLVGLELTRRLFAVALPPEIEAAIARDGRAGALAADAERRLRAGSAGLARDARLHLTLLDGPAARTTYVVRAMTEPTSRDRSAVPLPRALAWLYPVVRVARLAWVAVTGSRGAR